MGQVMFAHDLTAILRRAAPGFTIGASHLNGYREAGVYFEGQFVTHAERNLMDEVEREEQDPWFPSKAYSRSSWKHILRALCGSAKVPLDVRRRIWRLADKFGYRGFLRPSALSVMMGFEADSADARQIIAPRRSLGNIELGTSLRSPLAVASTPRVGVPA